MKPVTTLSCFEACGIQRFTSQEFFVQDQFCILKKFVVLFHLIFSMSFYITFKKENLSMWVTRGSYMWVTSGLLCGSVHGSSGSASVTHFQPCQLLLHTYAMAAMPILLLQSNELIIKQCSTSSCMDKLQLQLVSQVAIWQTENCGMHDVCCRLIIIIHDTADSQLQVGSYSTATHKSNG